MLSNHTLTLIVLQTADSDLKYDNLILHSRSHATHKRHEIAPALNPLAT